VYVDPGSEETKRRLGSEREKKLGERSRGGLAPASRSAVGITRAAAPHACRLLAGLSNQMENRTTRSQLREEKETNESPTTPVANKSSGFQQMKMNY